MATGFKIIRDGYTVDLDDVLVRRNLFDNFTYAGGYTGPRLNTSTGASLDEVFFTDTEIIDQYIGDKLWTWGSNDYGQLGTGISGTGQNRGSPGITAGGGSNWKQIEMGGDFVGGVKTDGTLWTWGRNELGQLGNGSVAPNYNTPTNSPGTTAGGGTNWYQVSIGEWNGAAIKTDGTLWTWGYNAYGKLGDGTTINRSSPVTTAGGGTNWRKVSAGDSTCAAIKADGTLWTWGYNASGEQGSGNLTARSSPGTVAGGGTNWKEVSVGKNSMVAVKTDGTLWTWGRNTYGQLGDGTTVSRSSPGTVAGGGTNWKQVSAGIYLESGAAIKTDGTLWTWGTNTGDGTAVSRLSPVTTAGGGTNWKQVSIDYQAAAIKTDGSLWTWGQGSTGYGNLGTGVTTFLQLSSPTRTVDGNYNWKQVSARGFYAMAAITTPY